MNIIIRKYGLNWTEIMNKSSKWLKNYIKSRVRANDWQISLIKELLLSRDGVLECGSHQHENFF